MEKREETRSFKVGDDASATWVESASHVIRRVARRRGWSFLRDKRAFVHLTDIVFQPPSTRHRDLGMPRDLAILAHKFQQNRKALSQECPRLLFLNCMQSFFLVKHKQSLCGTPP